MENLNEAITFHKKVVEYYKSGGIGCCDDYLQVDNELFKKIVPEETPLTIKRVDKDRIDMEAVVTIKDYTLKVLTLI